MLELMEKLHICLAHCSPEKSEMEVSVWMDKDG